MRTVTGGRGTSDGGGLSGWFGDDKHSGEGGEGGEGEEESRSTKRVEVKDHLLLGTLKKNLCKKL